MFGLLSGQPLTMLGLTGPDLVFESLVNHYLVILGDNFEIFNFLLKSTQCLSAGSSGLPVLLGLWLGISLLSRLDRTLACRHAHPTGCHRCQVQPRAGAWLFFCSFFVCYITRFTEECFACLIAIIFIIKVIIFIFIFIFIFTSKAVESTIRIGYNFPINPSPCLCLPGNFTDRL